MQQIIHSTQHPSMTAISLPWRRWRNPIADIYGQVLLMLLPLVVLTLILSPLDARSINWFNRLAPLYLVFVNAFSAYRMARAVPAALWSPAFWLLVSTAVFFGFGPLVEVYGNYETLLRLSVGRMAISEAELFRSNQLSFVSIVLLFLGFWLHTQLRGGVWRAALTKARFRQEVTIKPETLTIVFIVGGMILVHAFIMPSQWGQIDILVPGALTSVAAIVNVGFAMAAYLVVRGSKQMMFIYALLWPLHLFLTALSFAKSALMIALLLPAIGTYLGHRRMLRLAVASLVIACVYSLSQGFVHHGRAVIHEDTGTIWQAGYIDRIRIVSEYFTTREEKNKFHDSIEEKQGWWMRLNYASVQAIGMRLRDDAVGIDTLSNVWMMFVPRIIWPDKPIYASPGIQFYTLITGNEGTSVGISVFGDIYWQFGWMGIFIIIPMIGCMFAMMAWRSIEAIEQHNFIRMPLVLLTIVTAAKGLTEFLANGIIAVIPIYIAYLLLIYAVERFVRAQKHHGAPTRQSRPRARER